MAPTRLKPSTAAWAIGAGIAGLNVLGNGPVPERYSALINLAGSAAIGALAREAGLSPRELGFDRARLARGAVYGAAVAVPIAALLVAAARERRYRLLYRKRLIIGASTAKAVYDVFFRIPVGTALSKEIIFRGALYGLLARSHSQPAAVAGSSMLFGLWHILPALKHLEHETGTGGRLSLRTQAAAVLPSVAVTFCAGLVLSWLRIRSGSIVAPWLVHGATNAVGYVCVRSLRDVDKASEG